MRLRFLAFAAALMTSAAASGANIQVIPLFDMYSFITGTLIAFKVTGTAPSDIRRYEVEGAAESECRASRDPYYADIFHVKCVVPKDGLRLKITSYSQSLVNTNYSGSFSVREYSAGYTALKPASTTGAP